MGFNSGFKGLNFWPFRFCMQNKCLGVSQFLSCGRDSNIHWKLKLSCIWIYSRLYRKLHPVI